MENITVESERAWELAAEAIKRGELVVFPTDTVYGVGCDPYNVEALDRIYVAKGRPQQKAIPLLLAEASALDRVAGGLNDLARGLAARFWPGALTIVVQRGKDLPPQLGSGETIAVRMPDHDNLRHMIEKCGGAVAATSANRSGEPDALDASQAASYLGDYVTVYVDGGRARGGRPSTVVDCTGDSIRILREGDITADQVQAVVHTDL